jgi:hypothetical protein
MSGITGQHAACAAGVYFIRLRTVARALPVHRIAR